MKTKTPNSFEINFNQSYNDLHRQYQPELNKSWRDTLKGLSLSLLICLIVFPVVFIFIGMFYRNSCVVKPNIPLFLIIFGILILINLFIYTIAGATFLACERISF
jgi:hypothetical protein